MNHARRNLIAAGAILGAGVSISGCGTILHPERKGQIDGRLDPGIVVLNGIGLLLFLVPGVIAFAVDFSNGTIYLPGTQTSDASEGYTEHAFTGDLTEEKLDQAWSAQFGEDKPFAVEDLEKLRLGDTADIGPALAAASARKYAAL